MRQPAAARQPPRSADAPPPAAPFNGWYMGTGIGARNLADADRHDLLPVVAVLHSFDADLRPNFVHHRRAQPAAASAPSP